MNKIIIEKITSHLESEYGVDLSDVKIKERIVFLEVNHFDTIKNEVCIRFFDVLDIFNLFAISVLAFATLISPILLFVLIFTIYLILPSFLILFTKYVTLNHELLHAVNFKLKRNLSYKQEEKEIVASELDNPFIPLSDKIIYKFIGSPVFPIIYFGLKFYLRQKK
jgi:hypothetical protein